MSRIGNLPISVPKGVDVTLAPDQISIKGPWALSQRLSGCGDPRRRPYRLRRWWTIQTNAMSGTLRALVATWWWVHQG
jgi:large subunit ribosomal protein L6